MNKSTVIHMKIIDNEIDEVRKHLGIIESMNDNNGLVDFVLHDINNKLDKIKRHTNIVKEYQKGNNTHG